MGSPQGSFLREATGLVREISPLGAFAIGITGVTLPATIWNWLSLLPAVFPGANAIVVVLLLAIPVIFWAMFILMFNGAMPRSGGDYVWVSRTLNPTIGFMENFYFFFYTITILGGIGTLTVEFFNGFLQMTGIAFNAPSLISLSHTLSNPVNAMLTAAIPLLIFALISATGIKNVMRVQIVAWAITFIGVLAFIGILIATPHSVFVSNLNKAFGPNGFANILQTAQGAGAVTTLTGLSPSIAALPLGIFFISGWSWATYSGGELKSSTRASWASSVIPLGVTLAIFVTVILAAYNTYGYDFVSATGFLFNTNPSAIAPGTGAAAAPIALPWVYTVFTNANPYLIAFIGFGFALGLAVVMLPLITLVTRMLFAYSFDRLIPAKFGSVNDRFHTPIFSIAVATIVGLIVIYISNETTFFAPFLANTSIGFVIITLIVAIAAIVFPYGKKTKKIFEESRSFVKYKIGGVPLMSISGAITAITFIIVLYFALTSPTIGGVITPTTVVSSLLIPFLAPLVIYVVAKYYRKSKGIDIDLAFRQIPPE